MGVYKFLLMHGRPIQYCGSDVRLPRRVSLCSRSCVVCARLDAIMPPYGKLHRVVEAIVRTWKRKVGIDYAGLFGSLTPRNGPVTAAVVDLGFGRRFWFQRPHTMWLLAEYVRATPIRHFADLVRDADEGAMLHAVDVVAARAKLSCVAQVMTLAGAARNCARSNKFTQCAGIVEEAWRAVQQVSWTETAATEVAAAVAELASVPDGGVLCAVATLYCALFHNVRLEPGVAAHALMAAIPKAMWQWLLADAVERHKEGHAAALPTFIGQVASTCTLASAAAFWRENLIALERLSRMSGIPACVADDLLALRKQAFLLM